MKKRRPPALQRALTLPVDRPVPTLILAGTLALLAIVLIFRLHADTSLEAMFTRNDPSARAGRVLNDFPAADQLLILASLPDGASEPDVQKLTDFGRRFTDAVAKSAELARLSDGVFYQADGDSRAFVERVVAPSAIYYLDDAGFEAAKLRLTPEQMNAQLAQDRALLATPGPAAQALGKTIALDPLRLHEFIIDRLGSQKPFKTFQDGSDFVSPDGKALLIRVMGREPPSHLDYAHKIVDLSRQTAESVNSDSLQLEYAGAYAIATTSEQAIRHDMIESVIGSAILLQLLFIIIYRSPFQLFLLAFGPVALGILFGFAGFAIFTPVLTPVTAVLGAILAGMGIDYSIQYISLYEAQRRAGAVAIDAARTVATSMSGAVLAAWATSVVGFIAIGSSHVQALRDFAMLGALGLTGAFICVVALLPLMLRLTDRRTTPPGQSRFRKDPDRAVASVARRRHIWLALSLLAVAGAGIVAVRGGREVLPLETDLTVMHPRPNPAINAQRHLAKAFGISIDSLTVLLSADSPEKLVSLAYEAKRRLRGNPAASEQIGSTFGLADLLPDPANTASRRAALPDGMADRVVADFKSALAENGFAEKKFEPYSAFLQTLLSRDRAPGVADLLQYRHVAEAVLPASALSGKASANESLMFVFAKHDTEIDRAARDAAIDAARSALADLPGVAVTGLGVAGHDTERTIRTELPRLILIAVLASAIYLGIHFRSVADALLAMVPAAFGMLTAMALLRLLGEHLNMLNLVAIPLLIGIDVDYGIFLVNAARRRQVHGMNQAELATRVQTAVHAVTVCAMATGLGYISLASTSIPAERSLGIAAALGVATCLAGVLFLLLPDFGVPSLMKCARVLPQMILLFLLVGCSAPSGRLTFPKIAIEKSSRGWFYDMHHRGRADFALLPDSTGRLETLAYDDAGDGRFNRQYRLHDYANADVPHLIVMLDSIPYESMVASYRRGQFPWMDAPAKVIGPFPSLTEICYSSFLHAPPLPGVVDNYYDRDAGESSDTMWQRLIQSYREPWERRLDYTMTMYQSGLAYLHPREWYDAELQLARQSFDDSPNRVTIVYFASASSMLSKYGQVGLDEVLAGVQRLCLQVLYERQGAVKITLLADHGHNLTPTTNVNLAPCLERAGFNVTDRLLKPNDVVLELQGLVTYAGVRTNRAAQVSAALCNCPQADFAAYLDGTCVVVRNAQGSAAIECRDHKLRYAPIDADVLQYAKVIEQLRASGKADADGYASDADWFAATVNSQYPDGPRRLWDGFHGTVTHPPEVMLTMKDGWCAGRPAFEKFIRMASTHGSLNQVNTATFVMTMTGRVHDPMPMRDVLQIIEPGFEATVH